MDDVRDLKQEVGRIRGLMEAGRRGRPIGGELLAAFGAIVGLLVLSLGATAFSFIPLDFGLSPLAAAAAFLAAAVATTTPARQRNRSVLAYVVACLLAGAAAEIAWRAGMAWMGGEGASRTWLALVLLGGVFACFAGAALLGLVGLLRRSEALAPVNRALIGVWLAVAVAIVVLAGLCMLSGIQSGIWFAFMLLPSLFWMLWGLGWAISGWLSSSRWMHGVALGSWLLAAWQAYSFDFYWGSAAGLFALAMAPGLQLMREARQPHGEG